MERESFEDPAIARLMNELFVNIKAETVRQILDGLGHLSTFKEAAEPLNKELLDRVGRALTRHVDPVYGGFGRAPKFPNTMNHAFLLRHARAHQDEFALRMVTLTLEKMAEGGIFDHLGGGFYSTQDADSEGEEGKFFVWTRDEILAHLGVDAGQLFCRAYDVTEAGNFEHGRSILNRPASLDSVAARFGMEATEAEAILAGACQKLFEVRERRAKPFRDEKILTSWNGLMISACAEALNVLGDEAALEAAVRSAEFILAHMLRDGRLLRTFTNGQAKLNGYLDDYAFFVAALLDLHQATFDRRYLDQALALHERMIAQFWDEQAGGFFFTSAGHEALIHRPKSVYDHSIPSGASVATQTMLRLHTLTGSPADLPRAERILRLLLRNIECRTGNVE